MQYIPTLAAGSITPHEITVFFLSIGLLLGASRLLGEIARKFGQPTVLGEILAGVLLGSTVLGAMNPWLYDFLFPTYAYDAAGEALRDASGEKLTSNVRIGLDMFLTMCAAFLLLIAGLEVDLSSVWRQGKAAASVSVTGMVFPFAVGFGAAYLGAEWMGKAENGDLMPFALFVGIAMSITALPVIAKVLMDLNLLKSDMGMLIMSSAMVNDLLGWIGFAMVLAMLPINAADVDAEGGVLAVIGFTLLFVGGMLTAGRWVVHRVLPFVQAHAQWPGGVIAFTLTLAMFCAAITEWIGIHSIFGAFIIGIAIGDSSHLTQRSRDTIEQFITHIFAPIFFAGIGLRVDFLGNFDLGLVLAVLAIAIIGKLFGCYLGAKVAGLAPRESWAIGFGMCARGAMEIILGQLALDAGLISQELFVAIVVMALVTSLFPGPVMQALLQQKQAKTLGTFLHDKRFIPRLKASSRRAAITELSAVAAESAGLDAEVVDRAVWEREQIIPTGLDNGIAVPHATLEGLAKPVVAMGLSEIGIDFDARDGLPAKIICVLLTPADDTTSQIEMLSAVAKAFESPAAQAATLNAQNYTELLAAFNIHTKAAAH